MIDEERRKRGKDWERKMGMMEDKNMYSFNLEIDVYSF